jgi:hypothetical protein
LAECLPFKPALRRDESRRYTRDDQIKDTYLLPLAGALLGAAGRTDCAKVAVIGSSLGDTGGVLVLQAQQSEGCGCAHASLRRTHPDEEPRGDEGVAASVAAPAPLRDRRCCSTDAALSSLPRRSLSLHILSMVSSIPSVI